MTLTTVFICYPSLASSLSNAIMMFIEYPYTQNNTQPRYFPSLL